MSDNQNKHGSDAGDRREETVIAQWNRHQSKPAAATPQPRKKRYRLEVYAPQTRDGRDRILYYKTERMARLNAWMARQIGADRVVIVDTQPAR